MLLKSKKFNDAHTRNNLYTFLLWSSEFSANNGQAIVTRRVVDMQTQVRWISAVYRGGKGFHILSLFQSIYILWINSIFTKIDGVYLVCSRSTLGFIRDLPALVLTLFGVRVLVHAHGSDILQLLEGRPISPFARFLYRKCEIIVPSQHIIDVLGSIFPDQLKLCENFADDLESFDTLDQSESGEALRVLWNSNIISSKGFFDVAYAVEHLNLEGKEVLFTVLGSPIGDAEMNLEAVKMRLETFLHQPWFHYIGPVSLSDAGKYVASNHIVALPSRYPSECQPLAILQAMCSGKEVVIMDTPALRATVGSYPANVLSCSGIEPLSQCLKDIGARSSERNICLTDAAKRAKTRFSAAEFDRRMSNILTGRPVGN